jgi:hypothetical protein
LQFILKNNVLNEIFSPSDPYLLMHSTIDAFDSLCYALDITRHPGQIPEGKPAMATGLPDQGASLGFVLFIALK